MKLTAQQMKSLTKEDIKELCKQRGISHISAVLHDEFQSHRNPKLAKIQHWWFRQNHPFDRDVCSLYLKNCLKLGFYDDALAQSGDWKYVSDAFLIKSCIKLKGVLGRSVTNSDHVNRLFYAGGVDVRPLTEFGKENINSVLAMVDTILSRDYNGSLFETFCFVDENDRLKNNDTFQFDLNHFVIRGNHIQRIALACANIMREAENRVRIERGHKKIGEGFIRETELYYKLKHHFSSLDVCQHARPKFLGRQHYDIYFPKLKVAVEYQGLQHDEPVAIFGGKEAFKKTIERDNRKRDISKKNGVYLIEVRPNYHFDDVIDEINRVWKGKQRIRNWRDK